MRQGRRATGALRERQGAARVTGSWTGMIDAASLLVTALGLAAGALALTRTRLLGPALAVFMEMLTGAGLLRLAAAPTFTRALGAAGVLLIRRVAVLGLRADPMTTLLTHIRLSSTTLAARVRRLWWDHAGRRAG